MLGSPTCMSVTKITSCRPGPHLEFWPTLIKLHKPLELTVTLSRCSGVHYHIVLRRARGAKREHDISSAILGSLLGRQIMDGDPLFGIILAWSRLCTMRVHSDDPRSQLHLHRHPAFPLRLVIASCLNSLSESIAFLRHQQARLSHSKQPSSMSRLKWER